MNREATSDNTSAAHRTDRRHAHAEKESCTMFARRLEIEPEPVEIRIRGLVADHLGVSAEEIERGSS